MDYKTSTKFISSLAKIMQSLCNGYVEFIDNVQVTGHLYLSIDASKTIEYYVDETVTKSKDSDVVFKSNSFHAQLLDKCVQVKENKDIVKNENNLTLLPNDAYKNKDEGLVCKSSSSQIQEEVDNPEDVSQLFDSELKNAGNTELSVEAVLQYSIYYSL